MGEAETDSIKKLLEENGVEYKLFSHEPVYTSEQASRVRGVELKSGVKALLFKTNDNKFILGLVSADKRIDSSKLAAAAKAEALVLAKPEEVFEETGCKIGSVHPFGNLMNLPTYMDPGVLENEKVNFNVGMHTMSVQMKSKDLTDIVKPTIVDISR
jgi:Ala-tRNA(Pro) deacylase